MDIKVCYNLLFVILWVECCNKLGHAVFRLEWHKKLKVKMKFKDKDMEETKGNLPFVSVEAVLSSQPIPQESKIQRCP